MSAPKDLVHLGVVRERAVRVARLPLVVRTRALLLMRWRLLLLGHGAVALCGAAIEVRAALAVCRVRAAQG